MPQTIWLVVGLGNPGSQYRGTRHNVGFMVVDRLLSRMRQPSAMRPKFGAEVADADIGGHKALLCKPMEFMNVSGEAVLHAAQFWKVSPANTVVIHDDLDLPFARLKLGPGGGHGGHNGLRSIIDRWGRSDFVRVRVGIDRPPTAQDAANYVLGDFSRDEQARLPDLIDDAAAATEVILTHGLPAAMNRFNTKKKDAG